MCFYINPAHSSPDVVRRLLRSKFIKPDKYEREDSLMSAIEEIDDGQDVQASLVDVIKCVYDMELTDMIYKSVCANLKGPKAWAKERV